MMEHITEFREGYDCIKFECINGSKSCKPGQGGSHGLQGLCIAFISKGDKGAVQFLLSTGWPPQRSDTGSIRYRTLDFSKCRDLFPLPADLGFHSKEPHYDGHEPMSDDCPYTDGEPCYYDGSGLNAVDTSAGRVGTLLCWENYMPLARYALYSQGVEIYIAPTYDSGDEWVGTMQHIAREGRCWVISSGVALTNSDIPVESGVLILVN